MIALLPQTHRHSFCFLWFVNLFKTLVIILQNIEQPGLAFRALAYCIGVHCNEEIPSKKKEKKKELLLYHNGSVAC